MTDIQTMILRLRTPMIVYAIPISCGSQDFYNNQRSKAADAIEQLATDNKRLREALEIIAGDRTCLDNLMGNVDVARAALAKLKGDGDD